MSMLKALFKRYFSSRRTHYRVHSSYEAPEVVLHGVVYIIGKKGKEWLLLLKCPCGCGENIHLNLLKEARPRWRYRIKKGKISVAPSIWRRKGCKSHFFVRHGKIDWV